MCIRDRQNVINTKPKEQMSEEELEFHYFKMHDYDNNNKLDGVEIGKALTHFHDGKKSNLLPCLWCLMTIAVFVSNGIGGFKSLW